MASKGQKFNNYSDELRNEIISKYISGIPSSRLEKENNIPKKTIRNWEKKYSSHPELYPVLGKQTKKNRNERIEDNVKSNLLKRNFNKDASNKVWDTDVTYLIFKGSRTVINYHRFI